MVSLFIDGFMPTCYGFMVYSGWGWSWFGLFFKHTYFVNPVVGLSWVWFVTGLPFGMGLCQVMGMYDLGQFILQHVNLVLWVWFIIGSWFMGVLLVNIPHHVKSDVYPIIRGVLNHLLFPLIIHHSDHSIPSSVGILIQSLLNKIVTSDKLRLKFLEKTSCLTIPGRPLYIG